MPPSYGMMRALNGEVAEWSKAHAWKVCNGQPFEGSNPSLTAIPPHRICHPSISKPARIISL